MSKDIRNGTSYQVVNWFPNKIIISTKWLYYMLFYFRVYFLKNVWAKIKKKEH